MSSRSELPMVTDEEMLRIMSRDDNPLSRAWRVYRVETARIEQKALQSASILTIRRMEMEAVIRMLQAAGLNIRRQPVRGIMDE